MKNLENIILKTVVTIFAIIVVSSFLLNTPEAKVIKYRITQKIENRK